MCVRVRIRLFVWILTAIPSVESQNFKNKSCKRMQSGLPHNPLGPGGTRGGSRGGQPQISLNQKFHQRKFLGMLWWKKIPIPGRLTPNVVPELHLFNLNSSKANMGSTGPLLPALKQLCDSTARKYPRRVYFIVISKDNSRISDATLKIVLFTLR